MKIIDSKLPEVKIIEPEIFKDDRGYFFESFNQKKFNDLLNVNLSFVQDNQSKSSYGTIRGLHYQLEPFAQSKLIRAIQGKILDVVVDVREKSPTYGQHFSIELSCENKKQLFIWSLGAAAGLLFWDIVSAQVIVKREVFMGWYISKTSY